MRTLVGAAWVHIALRVGRFIVAPLVMFLGSEAQDQALP